MAGRRQLPFDFEDHDFLPSSLKQSFYLAEDSSFSEELSYDLWDKPPDRLMANLIDSNTQSSTPSGPLSPPAGLPQSSESSPFSPVSPVVTLSDEQAFKKHIRLRAYFTKQLVERRVRVVCKGCLKELCNGGFNRLMAHIKVCPAYNDNERRSIAATTAPLMSDNDVKNLAWTSLCVQNNISFRVVESSTMSEFARLFDWKPPSRHSIVRTYLTELDRRAKVSLSNILLNSTGLFLSIEFDHAQSHSMRHLLGVVATSNNGDRYVLRVQDDSLIGSYSNRIKDGVLNALIDLPPYSVNSFVSDSASTCKKARDSIVESEPFKHAISHRCLAHLFNLMGKEFQHPRVCPSMHELIKWVGMIVTLVARSTLYTAKLEQAGLARVKAYTPTRWYSLIATLEALHSAKTLITQEFMASGDRSKIQLVDNDQNWRLLSKVLPLIKPLVDCIGIAERANGSVGEAIRALLLYIKKLWSLQENCGLARGMVTAVLKYFSVEKLGKAEYSILLAAYATDRRFNVDFLTKSGLAKVMVGLMFVANKDGYQRERVISELGDDYNRFTSQLDEFGRLPKLGENAAEWWSQAPKTQVLTRVALRLAHLRSSSANIERAFSKLKHLHSLSRFSMSVDTIEKCMAISFEKEPRV